MVELTTGQVVRAAAGHDKGRFFIVLKRQGRILFLCDGKRRPMAAPKKKKDIHVHPTLTVLQPDEYKTDKAIRIALRPFAEQV